MRKYYSSLAKPPPGATLDRRNPLTRGLRILLYFNEGAGRLVQDLSGYGNHLTLVSAAVWANTQRGMTPTIASAGILGTIPANDSWHPANAITIMYRTMNVDGGFYWISAEGSNTNWGIYGGSTPRPYLRTNKLGGTWLDNAGYGTYSGTQEVTISQMFDGANYLTYADKTLIQSAAETGNLVSDTTTPITFGAQTGGSNLSIQEPFLFALWSERMLNADENAYVVDNPYDLVTYPSRLWEGVLVSGSTPVNVTDSGTSTETPSISASLALTDTGSSSETPSIAASLVLTDSATSTETPSIAAALPISDTGSATETPSIAASLVLTESATSSETPSIAAALPLSDTAAGAEAVALNASLALSDTGAGAETPSIAAALTLADAGTGVDSISINTGGTPVGVSDTGSGADALAVTATPSLSDSGVGSDSLSVTATFALSDTATAIEAFDNGFTPTGTGIPPTVCPPIVIDLHAKPVEIDLTSPSLIIQMPDEIVLDLFQKPVELDLTIQVVVVESAP